MVIKVKRTSTPRSGDEHDADELPRPKFSRKSLESLQDSGEAPLPLTASCFHIVDPSIEASATLVPKVAAALDKLLDSLEASAEISSQAKASPFHGQRPPPITLPDYLHRIAHYTKCSPACFVAALTYIDWIYQKDPSMAPCSLSIHRLMLVGSLLATKLLDDKRHSNAFWARVGGIPLHELNSLELHMMTLLDHHLLVTPEVMRRYIRQIQVGTLVLGYEHTSELVGRKRRSTGGYSSCCMSTGSEVRKSSRRDGGALASGVVSGPECSMGSVGRASSGQTTGRASSGAPSRQGSFCSVGLLRQDSLGHEPGDMSMGSVGISGQAGSACDDEDMRTDSEGPSREVVEQVAPRQASTSTGPPTATTSGGTAGARTDGEASPACTAAASRARMLPLAPRRPAMSASGVHTYSPAGLGCLHHSSGGLVDEEAGTAMPAAGEAAGEAPAPGPPAAGYARSVSASGTRQRNAPRRVSWADAKRSALRDMDC